MRWILIDYLWKLYLPANAAESPADREPRGEEDGEEDEIHEYDDPELAPPCPGGGGAPSSPAVPLGRPPRGEVSVPPGRLLGLGLGLCGGDVALLARERGLVVGRGREREPHREARHLPPHPVLGDASEAAEEEEELRGGEVRRPGDGGERERRREEQRVRAAGGGVGEVAVVRRRGGDEGGGERGEVVAGGGVGGGEVGDEVGGVAEDAGVEQRVRGREHPRRGPKAGRGRAGDPSWVVATPTWWGPAGGRRCDADALDCCCCCCCWRKEWGELVVIACSALLGLTSPGSSVFLPQLPWVWMKADRLDLFHELQISVSFSLRSQNTHTPKKIYIPIIFIHLCNPFIHSFMIFF